MILELSVPSPTLTHFPTFEAPLYAQTFPPKTMLIIISHY